MAEQKSTPSLFIRVLQGIVLGIVLSIPVVLWGLSRAEEAQASAGSEPASTTGTAAAKPSTARSRKAKTGVIGRKQVPVRKPDGETIPASQMHLRVDDGSRVPVSSVSAQTAKAAEVD
ncbi:hypothetical protein F183_A48530 [Bryobacterales bacterium F-183]|nr:hypothetical protein F183_A48530 [Bryobacterales bacterium F-183]